MFKEDFSNSWCVFLVIILLAEVVLSAPQGYNYYANQQRNYYAQRAAQAQRVQAQRIAAQNRYYQQSIKTTTTTRKPYKINRADSENAKFLGLQNQESDESGKTFKKKARKLLGAGFGPGYGYGPGIGNGCGFRKSDEPKGEGRVFWDLNFYNVYPGVGCGGGGAAGGGLADPYPGGFDGGYPGGGWADPYYGGRPIRGFFQNWLGLFLPGGALSGVNRPSAQGDGSQADTMESGSGAGSSGGIGPNGPNFQFLSDADVMMGITPNQLISGVASTVNNVLQQLSYPYYG